MIRSMQGGVILGAFTLACSVMSCTTDYVPKPHGYFRIELPEKEYRQFNPVSCPFSFEVPEYSETVPDTNALSESCWWYIRYPRFNGELYLSYKPVNDNLNKFIEDSYALVYKHTIKANEINEKRIATANNAFGVLYYIGGNAASSVQFFVTDSVNHFLRGALYFNVLPNNDSIAPVTSFIRTDIERLIETLKWENRHSATE